MDALPIIDVSARVSGAATERPLPWRSALPAVTPAFLHHRPRCRRGVPYPLESLSRQFFLEPLQKKLGIRMEPGGHAWRGYFPVRGELTSRKPDLKEGLYFGAGLPDYHPRVAAGTPLHGRNLFPDLPGFRAAVLDYMSVMTRLGCGTPSEHTWSRR